MDTNTNLQPKTKEVWADVRSLGTQESSLRGYINDLRGFVSGIVAYQNFLDQSSVDSFDDFESDLKTRSQDRLVEEDDVEQARSTAEDNFASFSSFIGDSGNDTGIFGLNDYDGYRGYLTSNGLDNVDADRHNTTIQGLYSADDRIEERIVDELTSFSDLETWFTNVGFSSTDASDFRSDLESEYADWSSFSTFVSNNGVEGLLDDAPHREQGSDAFQYDSDEGVAYIYAENEVRMVQTAPGDDPSTGDISFSNVKLDNAKVTVGDTVVVTAEAKNTASDDGDATAPLRIGGVVEQRKTVSVPANSTRTVRFETTPEKTGIFKIRVGAATSVDLTVKPKPR